MCSGRMPSTTCRAGASAASAVTSGRLTVLPSAVWKATARLAAVVDSVSAGMKFIDGEPMKPATNMLAGRL